VSAISPHIRSPKPPKVPRSPRVVEFLRKAIEWQALIKSGEARNQAEIARREGVTRARVTQVMGLMRLVPEIRETIFAMPAAIGRPVITERALRPIAKLDDPREQVSALCALVGPKAELPDNQ